ncbi:host-nuclease inhibitor Gam family protein [Clostridium massiliamazoniense]|uniref:host-nuclease inhibitor Gam family protein n=1 Tax=Clostridium massiliamazoniense TaxID=1347366 RepID=UPI0006D7E171|nr:host-nuclease inhibitor Gam family protein [Clostridium massiliamazoniense]
MEENTVLKGQIDIMEALKMIEETKEVQDIEVNEEETGFKIIDKSTCDWCFKLISEYKEEHKEINAYADAEIDKINKWREAELKHYDTSFLEAKLKEYYMEQRALNPKFRLSMPSGTVSSRKEPKYNYVDEEQVIKYLKENHSAALRVKEEIDKRVFRKIYKDGIDHETGEIIPGVEVSIVESFIVKTK